MHAVWQGYCCYGGPVVLHLSCSLAGLKEMYSICYACCYNNNYSLTYRMWPHVGDVVHALRRSEWLGRISDVIDGRGTDSGTSPDDTGGDALPRAWASANEIGMALAELQVWMWMCCSFCVADSLSGPGLFPLTSWQEQCDLVCIWHFEYIASSAIFRKDLQPKSIHDL